MHTRIRSVRRAKGLTLGDVASRCRPQTTAQTIGRLETGMRTLSVDWLNRIADALGVSTADLVMLPGQAELPVAALLGVGGPRALSQIETVAAPQPDADMVAVRVEHGVGDYRAGDILWCRQSAAEDTVGLLNRDALVPRPGGRFGFGRVIALEADRLALLPLQPGARQLILSPLPAWVAVVVALYRGF